METVKNKPKLTYRILEVLIAVLWLVICVEGASRLLFSSDLITRRLASVDNSSWRLAWISQHKVHKGDLYPFASGQCVAYHPTRGWALKTDIDAMSLPDGTFLNTNFKGLRGKTEYQYPRVPGKHRIIVIGDSFTFGEEVSDEETYPRYLESTLLDTEVLNLGVPGYGHDQMLLYLEEEGIKYHPDMVILGFVSADMDRNLLSFYAYAKPKFKLSSGRLELTNTPVPTPNRILAEEPYRLKTLDFIEIVGDELRWHLGMTETKARDFTRSLLDAIVVTTRRIGAVPIFVYLPILGEIADSSDAMTEKEKYLQSFCEDRGIPCLFLRRRFRGEIQRGVKFKTQGHWGPEAHKLAAQEIEEFLLQNHLFQHKTGEYH